MQTAALPADADETVVDLNTYYKTAGAESQASMIHALIKTGHCMADATVATSLTAVSQAPTLVAAPSLTTAPTQEPAATGPPTAAPLLISAPPQGLETTTPGSLCASSIAWGACFAAATAGKTPAQIASICKLVVQTTALAADVDTNIALLNSYFKAAGAAEQGSMFHALTNTGHCSGTTSP